MTRVQFTVGEQTVMTEFDDTPTARALLKAMPLDAEVSYWGGELYFTTSVRGKPDATAREVVEPGTVAFWLEGSCLCLFWGPTPVSRSGECRAASAVNVIAPDSARQTGAGGTNGLIGARGGT